MQAVNTPSMPRQHSAAWGLRSESSSALQRAHGSHQLPDPDSGDWSFVAGITAITGGGEGDGRAELSPCPDDRAGLSTLHNIAGLGHPTRGDSPVAASPASHRPDALKLFSHASSQLVEAFDKCRRVRIEGYQHELKQLESTFADLHGGKKELLQALQRLKERHVEIEDLIATSEWKVKVGLEAAALHLTSFSQTRVQDEDAERMNTHRVSREPSLSLRTASPPIPEVLQHYCDKAGEVGWRLERLREKEIEYCQAKETRMFLRDRGDQVELADDEFHASHIPGIEEERKAVNFALQERDKAKIACDKERIDIDQCLKFMRSVRASTSRQEEYNPRNSPLSRAVLEREDHDSALSDNPALDFDTHPLIPHLALSEQQKHDVENPDSRIKEWMNGLRSG